MEIYRNADVAPFTTFGIHATAAAVACYHNFAEALEISADLSLPRPLVQVGAGSNLLFTTDFPGTLMVNRMAMMSIPTGGEPGVVLACAGYPLDELCAWACNGGYWAMTNLSGIPGTVGGAVVQNAGAYGTDMSRIVRSVEVFDLATRQILTLEGDALGFGYRTSIFKKHEFKDRYFILWAIIDLNKNPEMPAGYPMLTEKARQLHPDGQISPMAVREAVLEIRASKLPDVRQYGSAGSFFKNPVISRGHYKRLCADCQCEVPCYPVDDDSVKVPAAWLIDKAGLKGYRHGGAAVWEQQPLVIVNLTGDATAADVIAVESEVRQRVHGIFGITLDPEVIHLP